MMEDIQHILGKLEAGIENVAEQQRQFRSEQRLDNKLLFERLDNISANGCALGKRNSDAIKELQNRPEKVIGIGAAIASIFAMIGAIVAAWRGH